MDCYETSVFSFHWYGISRAISLLIQHSVVWCKSIELNPTTRDFSTKLILTHPMTVVNQCILKKLLS